MDSSNVEPATIVDPGPEATGADLYRAGLAYSTGQGAPLCYVEAHKWFNLAALAGVAEAKVYRRELSELMSSAQIEAAQASARRWLTEAARGRGSAPRKTEERPVVVPVASAAKAATEKAAA